MGISCSRSCRRRPATTARRPSASRCSPRNEPKLAYSGSDSGRPVETAFTIDLINYVDATYRTIPARDGRIIGGYSMGGYGGIRYSIAHPDLFAASLVLSLKYGPGLTRQWARQFGTTETDGADAFAEGNVFLAVQGTTIWASGFTMGSTATQAQAGNGDVFLTSFDSQGTNLG